MNFGVVFKAFDTVMALREAAKRMTGAAPIADRGLTHTTGSAIAGQLRRGSPTWWWPLSKRPSIRDHARLELERAQLEEQRRRAEEAMRLELRRQTVDRELARLRMLTATALVGWGASVAVLLVRLGTASVTSRGVMAAGWLLLLGALASAFRAQQRVGLMNVSDAAQTIDAGSSATAALWLLMLGLAVSAMSLLF